MRFYFQLLSPRRVPGKVSKSFLRFFPKFFKENKKVGGLLFFTFWENPLFPIVITIGIKIA